MRNFYDFQSIRPRAGVALATLGAAVLIAGCGSSGSSNTIGVGVENKGDATLAKSNAPATTTAPRTPTVAAKTPASGPLSKEPTVTPPSGAAPSKLIVKDLIAGTGAEAKASSSVTVNYVGVLFHGGKVFDASWKRAEPSTFPLSGVIPGWTQGIPGMKVGGRRELIIPSSLAYGAKGTPGIPPNSPLVFVIDLLGV